MTAASSPHQPLCQLTAPLQQVQSCCAECLSSRKRIDDAPASKLPSARGFPLEHDGQRATRAAFAPRPFWLALVNRGRDAAWAKSYGSIG